MYKILIADDKNEINDCIKEGLEQNFPDSFQTMVARTGRKAIEAADEFRPDIVFMDLELPGISGIDAMREIRNHHPNVVFVIVSACAKFDYAKEAIGIGILDYVSKPFEQESIVKALKAAVWKVEEEKKKRSLDLEIKEKLEIITPIIENGFVNALLYQKSERSEIEHFCSLLGIAEKEGYFMTLQFGELSKNEQMQNVIGTSVRLQKEYTHIKDIIKQYFHCCVGSMMGNKILIFVPQNLSDSEQEYDLRIQMIEDARKMVRDLRNQFDAKFKVGVGAVHNIYNSLESYNEAMYSLEYNSSDSVVHINDLPISCEYEDNYPVDTEMRFLKSVEVGNINEAVYCAKCFFQWMVDTYRENTMDIKLKVLELVLRAEAIGFENGGMPYRFTGRSHYLESLMEMQGYQQLQKWLEEKVVDVCRNIHMKKEESTVDVVKRAKKYIQLNYAKDIDLEDVSKHLQISPYYFSKLFKKKTGKNFIEYLTQIRMEQAKKLLSDTSMSMKEICMEVGYSDANYFSRAFKKNVGLSPTEYKEERCGA
ncbi:MAG: helix-turn-helix domain-containing protein [Lachnospiraceae bacterium]|nr:helix-turn-helix domain-containing protein [Lachnospiraceae bacterium]